MFDDDNVEDADNGEPVAHNQLFVCLHCVRVLETEVHRAAATCFVTVRARST